MYDNWKENENTYLVEEVEHRTGITVKEGDVKTEIGENDELVEARVGFQKFLGITNSDSYNFVESGYNHSTKMGTLEISSKGTVLFLKIFNELRRSISVERVQMYIRKDMENPDSMIHGFEIKYKGE